MSTVSIVIRTHNEETWIAHTLRKLKTQTFEDFEVVLVDNESTDKTVPKALDLIPDAAVVEISEYLPGDALNRGIAATTGEFIICLSAHCIPVDERWLERFHDNITLEGVAGVYGRQLPLPSSDPIDTRDLIRTFGVERRVQERDSFFHNANSCIRREVWEEHPFDAEVTNIEDHIWGAEVIAAGYTLIYEPAAAVYHHHGINHTNAPARATNVVGTMREHSAELTSQTTEPGSASPFDPATLDIIAMVPLRHHVDSGVDFNESLVRRTLSAAEAAQTINEVIVTADSEALAERAVAWGASAPFTRPEELSGRDVPVTEVYAYTLERLEESGRYPDLVVPLEITHPFRPPGLLDQLVETMLQTSYDMVTASAPEYRPCFLFEPEGGYDRLDEDTQQRRDRTPVQVGLLSLGYVAHPTQIREGRRVIRNMGVVEVRDPLAAIEIRDRDDLTHWERLSGLTSG